MYLTREEEAVLEGEMGEAHAKLMKLLVAIGEIYGADRMLAVSSVHVSGVSYKNIGRPGLSLLEDLASQGARVKPGVKATLNPAGMDLERWRDMGVGSDFAWGQLRVYEAFRRMGLSEGLTCTPYEAGNKPKIGEHAAWAESSAIAYANSVLATRTNRESGITALASAVLGKTPNYGFHLDENRKPTLLVEVEEVGDSPFELGALGYLVGLHYGDAVPYFRGLRGSLEGLKALGSAMASSGAVALYHVEGLTPEAGKFRKELGGAERLRISGGELRQASERFTPSDRYDCIFIGCPHCSLEKLKLVAGVLEGRKVKGRLWLCTSRHVYAEAWRLGLVKVLEEAGALILRDTCMVVAPLRELGINTVLTDSFKAAHYLSMGFEAYPARLEDCLRKALED